MMKILCSILASTLIISQVLTELIYIPISGKMEKELLHYNISTTNRTAMVFEVQSCSTAVMRLYSIVPPSYKNEMFEILLGTRNAEIVAGINNTNTTNYSSPVLKCYVRKTFWISWLNGTIQVGWGDYVGIDGFMQWNDPLRRPVNHIDVYSQNNMSAKWYIESDIPCRHETMYRNASGVLVLYNQTSLTYKCDLTITSGNLYRSCLDTGVWSGKEPKCEITCSNDTATINSSGYLDKITGYTIAARLVYVCQIGDLWFTTERRCQSNGTWNGREPDCDLLNKCHYRHHYKQVEIRKVVEEIRIDKKMTSKQKRRKKSASDKRTSSKVIGGFAIGILVIIVIVVIIIDLPTLIIHLQRPFSRLRSRCRTF